MILPDHFIKGFSEIFQFQKNLQPWEITKNLPAVIEGLLKSLGEDYVIRNGMAIHKSATIEDSAILKGPMIIGEKCFVGANAYLRGGVYLGAFSSVGPSCEIKSSVIFSHTEIAHLNFVGDSIFGSHINFEAGAVAANYFNEREEKKISVWHQNKMIPTHTEKFGSLVGDHCKIGANAVLSPGTILEPRTIVKRLELVDQQQ